MNVKKNEESWLAPESALLTTVDGFKFKFIKNGMIMATSNIRSWGYDDKANITINTANSVYSIWPATPEDVDFIRDLIFRVSLGAEYSAEVAEKILERIFSH